MCTNEKEFDKIKQHFYFYEDSIGIVVNYKSHKFYKKEIIDDITLIELENGHIDQHLQSRHRPLDILLSDTTSGYRFLIFDSEQMVFDKQMDSKINLDGSITYHESPINVWNFMEPKGICKFQNTSYKFINLNNQKRDSLNEKALYFLGLNRWPPAEIKEKLKILEEENIAFFYFGEGANIENYYFE